MTTYKLHNSYIYGVVLLVFVSLTIGCGDSVTSNNGEAMVQDTQPISEDVRQALHDIKNSRILFFHKSVGRNILAGLNEIATKGGVELKIRKIEDETIQRENIFVHSEKGENRNPQSKIDAFYGQLLQLDEFAPQIAFMKLCYLDVTSNTDVEGLFEYYRGMMKRVETERPDIKVIHFTVPLTSRSYSLKSQIKRLVGMTPRDDSANMKRAEFNSLLKTNFAGDTIFDIAQYESTHPNGHREQHFIDGKAYYAMSPIYTNDGGHLNQLGQQSIALELVFFLADILRNERKG